MDRANSPNAPWQSLKHEYLALADSVEIQGLQRMATKITDHDNLKMCQNDSFA